MHDLLLTEEWSYDSQTHRLHNETLFDLDSRSEMRRYDVRLYAREELVEMLRAAGFDTIKTYGGFDREPYDEEDSSRMIFVAERKK